MKLLVIDTTSRNGIVAIGDDRGVLAEQLFAAERSAAALLPLLIRQAMDDARLEMSALQGIAVATGPGSFTGLRVGVAAAKGLAYALTLPVAGFSSLALLAMNFPFAANPVCILHDARKHEVYAGLYRMTDHPLPLAPEEAVPPEILAQRIKEPTIFAGEGASVYADLLRAALGEMAIFSDPVHNAPRGAAALALGLRVFASGGQKGPESLLPVYLRLSEAELSRR
jgi:tRNA threonylcarbamoyladenosine biosynthesis protein TsaB